jgi:hypothetical protein
MNFKQEFLVALKAGQDFDALMDLVRRHKKQGLTVDAAYEALHQIWLEYSFDQEREDSALQDNLEAVMEKVWYGSPV